jgi:hypothetical protein
LERLIIYLADPPQEEHCTRVTDEPRYQVANVNFTVYE